MNEPTPAAARRTPPVTPGASDAVAPEQHAMSGKGVTVEVRGVLDAMPAAVRPDTEAGRWVVEVVQHDERTARVAESLLTVADGVVGTRGSLEEDGPSAAPGLFVAGVYEPAEGTGQALVTLESWATLALPSWLEPGRRLLDLHSGVLWRSVESDGSTVLRSARWASLARPGTEVLVVEADPSVIDPEDHPRLVTLLERRSPLGGWVTGIVETTTEVVPAHEDGHPSSFALVRTATLRSGDGQPAVAEPVESQRQARRAGVAQLFSQQQQAWARRWRTADVEVVGDPELTLAVRFALFQLAGAVGDTGEAAVGARGLSGPAYAGHVFWDADVFVLPVLASIHPASARAMLEYRLRRLAPARAVAAAQGRQGARFPWESAADGEDVTPRQGIDASGQVVPISTGDLEEHITADVAWAAWRYASATGDRRFLAGPGGALVIETARYWASRVRVDADGRGHIDQVTGPDEYHEGVDDNAFTNVMAAWNLRRGAELLERHRVREPGEGHPGRPEPPEEARQWRAVAEAMVTGFTPDLGRHRQFAGYDDLELLLAADVGPVPLSADLVLGRERLIRSQIIKQADVVMAHHMVPEAMAPGSLQADFDHYLARTVHGSSLSPAVYASVAARAGRLDQAVNLLDLARRVDIDDLTGTTSAGLHMAALGGLWQALVFGFAGVRFTSPDDTVLVVDPKIPEHWGELRVRMLWHGTPLSLRFRNDVVRVDTAAPIEIRAGGLPVAVAPPGGWVEVEAGER